MDNNKNLLFVVGSLGSGGVERVASLLGNHLAQLGWNITIVMLLDNQVHYTLDPSIDVRDLSRKSHPKILNIRHWIKGIQSVHAEKGFHTAISFFLKGGMVLGVALKNKGVKLIARESEDPRNSRRGLLTNISLNHYLKNMNHVVFQSNYQQKCFPKNIRALGRIIPNPVLFSASASIPYLQREKRIVTVGRLIANKNIDFIIMAFSFFLLDNPGYRLEIYGDGPQRKRLAWLISDLHLDGKVLLKGISKSISTDIVNAKAFVLASKYEGQSNALIEAMMLGVPSISSNWKGVEDIISDHQNGLIFDKNDFVGLVSRLNEIINNGDLAELLIAKSKELVDKYAVETIAAKWLEMIM